LCYASYCILGVALIFGNKTHVEDISRKISTCAFIYLQARGLKKHLKRLNAPKHWMLDKLGGAFVSELSLSIFQITRDDLELL